MSPKETIFHYSMCAISERGCSKNVIHMNSFFFIRKKGKSCLLVFQFSTLEAYSNFKLKVWKPDSHEGIYSPRCDGMTFFHLNMKV